MTMINLLVADDHSVIREALCEMLRGRGKYNIVGQAGNGAAVLELLKSVKPDLIIMDVTMPQMDGIAALQEIAARGGQPPVLMLSAAEGEKAVRAALRAGAKGYLPKKRRPDRA